MHDAQHIASPGASASSAGAREPARRLEHGIAALARRLADLLGRATGAAVPGLGVGR